MLIDPAGISFSQPPAACRYCVSSAIAAAARPIADDRTRAGVADDREVDGDAVGQVGALDTDIDDAEFQDGAAMVC